MKVEDGATFAIERGTLEIATIPRMIWKTFRSSKEKGSHTELTLHEFSRPWRAFRLKKNDGHSMTNSEKHDDPSLEDDILKHYEPNASPFVPFYPTELHAPSFFRDSTAVEGSTAYKVAVKLSFNIGAVEPIFCRLALYDLNLSIRVSEDFCFQINSPSSTAKEARLIKNALFYVTPNQSTPNLYLVLQASKVLQGDIELSTLHYCQPEKYSSESEQTKLIDKAAECIARLGNAQQNFAWGSISLTEGVRQMFIYRQKGSMSDEQRLPLILDASKGTMKERLIPCICEMDIEKVDELTLRAAKKRSLELKVSPTATGLLYLVDPMFHDPAKDLPDSLQWCHEIQPFCPPQHHALWGPTCSGPVAVSFMHTIYVYPIALDRFQHRNIAVKVQLLDGEVEIPAFYSDKLALSTEYLCHVTYHNKTPSFEDEVKIALPLALTASHQLVFTFYHVHCKKVTAGKLPMDLLGRAILPLVDTRNVLLPDMLHSLPVIDSEIKGMGFQVRSRSLSSVHSQDYSIQGFFQAWQVDLPVEELLARIVELKQASSISIRFHLLRIFRQLFAYVCHENPTIRSTAFGVCLGIFDKCSNSSATSSLASARKPSATASSSSGSNVMAESTLILKYIDAVFDEEATNNAPMHVYQSVILEWIAIIESDQVCEERRLAMLHANALLHLIAKSIAFQWPSQSLPQPMHDVDMISKLMNVLLEASLLTDDGFIVRKDLLLSVARFSLVLCWIIQNPISAIWIQNAINRLAQTKDSAMMIHITFPFLKLFSECDLFVSLNTIGSNVTVVGDAWLAQLLFLTLIDIVNEQKEEKIKSHAIGILRRLFVIQMTGQYKERVAMMFLPVLPELLGLIKQFDQDDCDIIKRDVLVCLIACLSHLPESQLKGFWKPRYLNINKTLKRRQSEFEWTSSIQNHVYNGINALKLTMDCFLGDGLPWQQLLSPDSIDHGKQLSLLDIEVYMKQRNTRRSQLTEESTSTTRSHSSSHRSLPRNWGKNYLAQRKHSVDVKPISKEEFDERNGDDMEIHSKHLCICIARTLVSILQTLVHEFSRQLIHIPSFLAMTVDIFFALLTRIGHGHFDPDIISSILTNLTVFLGRFQKSIFNDSNMMLMIDELWCERLILLATSASNAASLASTFLCSILATCFDQLGTFLRVKSSILKVLSKHIHLDYTSLLNIMGNFPGNKIFQYHLNELLNFIKHIINTWIKYEDIENKKKNLSENIQDNLIEIIKKIPSEDLFDVQLKFIDALTQHHIELKQYSEATQCKLYIISILKHQYNTKKSNEFLLNQLKLAKSYINQLNMPETILFIDEKILKIAKKQKNYNEYIITLKSMNMTMDILAQESVELEKPPNARYFIISIINLNEPEYIYKRSPFCHITDIMESIQDYLHEQYPTYKIKPICSKMETDCQKKTLYLKATPIEPLFKGESGRDFLLCTPFSIGKHQFVRRIHLRVRHEFPFLSMRQPVVTRQEFIRCPIETATDDIERRTNSLQRIVAREEKGVATDVKAITHLLKGSINTEVNGGAPEVIMQYLGKDAICVDSKGEPMLLCAQRIKQTDLRVAILKFLQVALQVLSISRELFRRSPLPSLENDDASLLAPLQGEFEKSYTKTLAVFASTYDTEPDEITSLRSAVAFKLAH